MGLANEQQPLRATSLKRRSPADEPWQLQMSVAERRRSDLSSEHLLYEVGHALLAERAEVDVVRLEARSRSWRRYGAPASAWDGGTYQECDNAVGFQRLEVARTAAPETRRAAIRAVPPIRPTPEETQ